MLALWPHADSMNSEVSATSKISKPSLWARALDGDSAALESLAERYWYPAYVWMRTSGNSAADTAFHTLSFFTRLQNVSPPRLDEPSTARLRDFLLVRLKDFATEGFPTVEGLPTFLLDIATAERRFAHEPQRGEDDVYARRWSLTVLESTLLALRAEYEAADKAALFDTLKPFLGFHKGDDPGYARVALTLGMSTSAFHLAAYNFRIRYREVLRNIIADTVRFEEDVDSELTVLLVGAS